MDPPRISRWFCALLAIGLLAVSVIVAVVQSTELQLGCLLRTKHWGASRTGQGKRNNFFSLDCGRASTLYVEDNSDLGQLRSVQPITQGAIDSDLGAHNHLHHVTV